MFTYKGFSIDTSDDLNADLYELQDVEICEKKDGGGKGRGKATGEFRKENILVGHYNSFRGAFDKMTDMLMGRSQDVTELKKVMQEMRTVASTIGRECQLQIFKQAEATVAAREERKNNPDAAPSTNKDGTPRKKRGPSKKKLRGDKHQFKMDKK